MNLNEIAIVGLLTHNDIDDGVESYRKKGISVGSSTECSRYLYLDWHKPRVINGIEIQYRKSIPSSFARIIMDMGIHLEDSLLSILKNNNVEVLTTQMICRDLHDKWRGKTDIVIRTDRLGICILEIKSMSDKIFSRFVSNGIKEEKYDYYIQSSVYHNVLKPDHSFVVGVNRSNAKIHVEETTKSENDFLQIRAKIEGIINAKKLDDLPILAIQECDGCEFINSCRAGEDDEV